MILKLLKCLFKDWLPYYSDKSIEINSQEKSTKNEGGSMKFAVVLFLLFAIMGYATAPTTYEVTIFGQTVVMDIPVVNSNQLLTYPMDFSSPASSEVLSFDNAGQVVNATVLSLALPYITPLAPIHSPIFTGTAELPTVWSVNGTVITPDGAELNYVNGVTSAIQTQINGKLGTAETAVDSDKLDGQHGAYYLSATGEAADSSLLQGFNAAYFLSSTGEAADSQLLDGFNSTYFLSATGEAYDSARLGGDAANLYAKIANQTHTGITQFATAEVNTALIIPTHTPANSVEVGVAGCITWDANYIYVWTTNSHVKRSPLNDTGW